MILEHVHQIRGYIRSDIRTISAFPVEIEHNGDYDWITFITEEGLTFRHSNYSPYRSQCRYELFVSEMYNLPLRLKITCELPEEDAMLLTLEHGEGFFFQNKSTS